MLPPLPSALAEHCAGRRAERVLAGEAGAVVMRLSADGCSVRYVKYGVGAVAGDITDEVARLVWLRDRVACPAVVQFVREADAAWLLTEALPGLTGDQWLERDPARLPNIIAGAAALLRGLHALPVVDCPFEAGAAVRLAAAARNVAAGAVDCDDFDDDHAGWSAEAVYDAAVALAPGATGRVVTHGDFSLGNLLFDEAGRPTGVIDVGRLGVADPYQDIAIFWQNMADFGAEAQAAWLAACGVGAGDRDRLDFHRLLDELF